MLILRGKAVPISTPLHTCDLCRDSMPPAHITFPDDDSSPTSAIVVECKQAEAALPRSESGQFSLGRGHRGNSLP